MTTRNRAIQLPAAAGLPEPLSARHATARDEQPLTRLWLLFRHHLSAWSADLPAADGSYRSEGLRRALSDPGWNAWLLTAGEHPIGLALTRAMHDPVHVLNSFFLVIPARGRGLGRAFARTVVAGTPGRWSVAFQDANPAAVTTGGQVMPSSAAVRAGAERRSSLVPIRAAGAGCECGRVRRPGSGAVGRLAQVPPGGIAAGDALFTTRRRPGPPAGVGSLIV
jgi:predicted acetyltransferase